MLRACLQKLECEPEITLVCLVPSLLQEVADVRQVSTPLGARGRLRIFFSILLKPATDFLSPLIEHYVRGLARLVPDCHCLRHVLDVPLHICITRTAGRAGAVRNEFSLRTVGMPILNLVPCRCEHWMHATRFSS